MNRKKKKNFDPDLVRQDVQAALDARSELADRRASVVVRKILDKITSGKYSVIKGGEIKVIFWHPGRLDEQDVSHIKAMLPEFGLYSAYRHMRTFGFEEWDVTPREPAYQQRLKDLPPPPKVNVNAS